MSIDKTRASGLIPPAEQQPSAGIRLQDNLSPSGTVTPAARVNLSRVPQLLHNTSQGDIRQSKVNDLRQAIADGNYRTDSRIIANGIADSLRVEHDDAD